jgi:hypothetical protein
MKKRSNFPDFRIDSREVWSFLPIACPAAESQIVGLRQSPVLLCNNMLDVEWPREHRLWKAAVLAEPGSAAPNLACEIVHVCCAKTRRALECHSASKSPTFTYASNSAFSASFSIPSLAFAFSSSIRRASLSSNSSDRMIFARGTVNPCCERSKTFRNTSAWPQPGHRLEP